MRRRLWLGLACAAALCACQEPPADSPADEVRLKLPGTWLREHGEGSVRVRRILVLETDGQFSEQVRIVDAGGMVTEQSHAGRWTFDGTNLKRKYSLMDGKPPSAPTIPFATFALKLPSKNEFVGTDNVRRREVRYRRVPAGTLP
jgi:hypothetical protein